MHEGEIENTLKIIQSIMKRQGILKIFVADWIPKDFIEKVEKSLDCSQPTLSEVF